VEARWQVADVTPQTASLSGDDDAILWGFPAGEPIDWRVEVFDDEGALRGSAEGSLPTFDLAGAWMDLRVVVQGEPAGVPPVLFRVGCPGVDGWAWVDPEGRVRGVQNLDGNVLAVSFDGDAGVLALLGRTVVEERGLDGVVRWSTTPSDDPLHHDVHRDDRGLTWVLSAEVVDGVVSDGLVVLDEGGERLATWRLADHLTPGVGQPASSYWASAFPAVPDWSHGNSITVRDGRGLLSLRWLDAVLELDADLDGPDFGRVLWQVTGRPGEIASDARWSDGGEWEGQHHPTWTADGDLLLFDNRSFPNRSRVVRVGVSGDRAEMEEEEAWQLDRHCPVQGAAYELADGRILATCGSGPSASVFRAGSATPDWEVSLACLTAPHRVVPRFVPMAGVLQGVE